MKRGSTIIQSSSVTAYKGSAAMIDYSSTKGALVSFTRSMAFHLAPRGIRVNAVAPGPVYTPLQPASRSEDNMEGWGIGGVPLHGRPGQPAEMGATYVYLADAGASNIMTGQVLHLSTAAGSVLRFGIASNAVSFVPCDSLFSSLLRHHIVVPLNCIASHVALFSEGVCHE